MSKLLVVVDMQNDFVFGSLGSAEAQKTIKPIEEKIKKYLDEKQMVVFTRDTHDLCYLETQEGKNLPVLHCKENSDGWQIVKELQQYAKTIFNKDTFGSFDLAEFAKKGNFSEIELVGVCTDICVITCALMIKAACKNSLVKVDGSCCAGVSTESHDNALKAMRVCHISC